MSLTLRSPHHIPLDTTARQNTFQTFTTFFSFDFQRLQSLPFQYSLHPIHRPSTSELVGFLFSILPLQIYLVFLLCLPSVYKARINGTSSQALLFQVTVAEWRLLKGISTLVLSAVLAIFQLQGAFADPLLRLTGFLSVSFGFFSILYGCLLINQLGSLGTARTVVNEDAIESGGSEFQTGDANRWSRVLAATEEGHGRSNYWNIPVLLALPAVWTAWSVMAFVCTFILLLYRSAALTHNMVALTSATMANVAVMAVLVLGTMYLVLAIHTLRSL